MDWKAYRDDLESRLRDLDVDIAIWSDPNTQFKQKTGDGPWEDIRPGMIDHMKRTAETYRSLIDKIDRDHLS